MIVNEANNSIDTLMSEIRRNIMILREANNGMDALMSAPIRIKETNYRLLFGLISLSVCVDDFCPSSDDSEIKYKTQINLRIFSFTLRFKGWSSNPPTVIVNNVDDNYGIKYMLELATLKTSESNSERDAKIIKRFLTNLGIE